MTAIELLEEKIARMKMELAVLEGLRGELAGTTTEPESNLRGLTLKVLQDHPTHRMSRRDIIRAVKAIHPSARHIGVVSALSNREWFRKVGKDEFELK